MPMRGIERDEWATFLDDFSREHRGCVCTLEVYRPGVGREIAALGRPLEGVTFESGHGPPSVQIFVGGATDHHVGHTLVDPRLVCLEVTPEGARTGLRIEAEGGALQVRFRSPQVPDYVEGYLP